MSAKDDWSRRRHTTSAVEMVEEMRLGEGRSSKKGFMGKAAYSCTCTKVCVICSVCICPTHAC
jgi:hypothetical protein